MARTPYVNASLMHEIRMISMVAIPALIPVIKKLMSTSGKTHVVGMTCATCLQLVNVGYPEPAITVVNGTAVCHRHIPPIKVGATR